MNGAEGGSHETHQVQGSMPEQYRDWFTAPGDVDDFIFYDEPDDAVSGR